ncbi:AAA family ATPase [Aerosakkonema sp. BLCC-F183]|uniref:AAA family ATPase n=1 Tax=Aerosakkonema sp. BLCC-F183 TaxID=3342834 RepID=UPI0035BC32D5
MTSQNLTLIEGIETQLTLLGYGLDDVILFRAIKTGKNSRCQKIKCKGDELPYEKLQELQKYGYNLYLVINGGDTDAEVKSGRAIFYEHDNLSKDIQRELWQHLNLPEPTFQVDTGGKSIHSYWVFDRSIPIEQWKTLQADLLEFADADRSIKNPSRVMRLAGSVHQGTKQVAAIVSKSAKTYNYEQLKAIISPIAPIALVPTPTPIPTPTQKIPLENCLTKQHRDFLGGVAEGNRNKSGAALVRDLIGTAARLEYLGIEYAGSARGLFEEFANRCNPPLPAHEAKTIWDYAQKKNPTACLTDDAIANCVKAWKYTQKQVPALVASSSSSGSGSKSLPETENSGGSDLGNGGRNGSGNLPPSNQPNPDEVFKLEVLAYSNESDPFKKMRMKGQICANYRISAKELQELVDFIKGRSTVPKAKRFTGAEFILLETEGIKWLIPGIVPGRGVTILGGAPGAGKTTIAYDMAASILYQESFLGEDIDRPGKVLFVSSDEQPCFAQDKFINRGFTFNDQWQFVTDWDISQKQEFEEYLDDFRPLFVMMDSFAAIHRDESFDENSSQAKANIYWLESMANKYGCAILLIHHCNKNSEQKGVAKLRGNTAIAGACSAVLLLEGEGNVKSLSAVKMRGSELFKWDVKLDPETGRYSVVQGKIDDSAAKTLSEKILLLFSTKYPTTRLEVSEIREEVGGQADALYKALDRLCKRGLLVKRPSEKNRRFKVYGLPLIQSESTPDTIPEHSPPQSPVNDTDPTFENLAQIEIQTLDTILDTHSTTLDTNLEPKAETLTQTEVQTLDGHLSLKGGSEVENVEANAESEEIAEEYLNPEIIDKEVDNLAMYITLACTESDKELVKEALLLIWDLIQKFKKMMPSNEVASFRAKLWNKLSVEQQKQFKLALDESK